MRRRNPRRWIPDPLAVAAGLLAAAAASAAAPPLPGEDPGRLAAGRVEAAADAARWFRPDYARMATTGQGRDRKPAFRVVPAKRYPVLEVGGSRKQRIRVGSGLDDGRSAWIHHAPAELLTGDHPPESPYYSYGWTRLYQRAQAAQDGPLREQLRAMNRGLWALGYDAARDAMFSALDNRDGAVTCVYTGMRFPAGKRPGEGPDGEFMNTEHTWPQSFFKKREPMRSDLHHLFPTESESNRIRSSNPMRELGPDEGVAIGPLGARSTEDAFEPPAAHKGNVARALLYFAVQYRDRLDAATEKTLRAWHRADPVDEAERVRNTAIYELQRSRNFFVDRPDLVERIADF